MAVHAIEFATAIAESTGNNLLPRSVAVTNDHPVMAAALVAALNGSGHQARVVGDVSSSADAVVITSGLAGLHNSHPGSAATAHQLARCSIDTHWRALEHARATHHAQGRVLVVLQNTAGGFQGGETRSWQGGFAALARTAAREWPQMQVRCVDVDMSLPAIDTCAARVVGALQTDHPELGVDNAGRIVIPQFGSRLRQPPPRPSSTTDVWLVTGGARGVTAACVLELARRTNASFALLGRVQPDAWPTGIGMTDELSSLRSALAVDALKQGSKLRPTDINRKAQRLLASQEILQTQSAIRAVGSEVQYYTCDVTDPDHVRRTIDRVEKTMGTITGVVHGAGVLADRLIVDKTRAEFEQVFNTKVCGLAVLLDALALDNLKHMALFTSAAAVFGNPGQADYAMANEVMNRVARALSDALPEARIKSFNWGPWDGGMVGPELARHFAARGIGLIDRDVGARLFVSELLDGRKDDVELLIGDHWSAA